MCDLLPSILETIYGEDKLRDTDDNYNVNDLL